MGIKLRWPKEQWMPVPVLHSIPYKTDDTKRSNMPILQARADRPLVLPPGLLPLWNAGLDM